MAHPNFSTRNETFRRLFGNGITYRIPRFQRDYSWTQVEWEDLWEDILATFQPDGDDVHYMGHLVLRSTDGKQHDVIDGQQRLTTLSIIVLAAISHLQDLGARHKGQIEEQNRQRADLLRNRYIEYLDIVSLRMNSKLSLNRHDDRFYQNCLVPLESMPSRNLRASEHRLRQAFDWFKQAIEDYAPDSGEKTIQLVDQMADHLFCTVVTVIDELNAFSIFETLNARGVRLSSTDLLKNHLFSLVSQDDPSDHQLAQMEQRWERVVENLGSENLPEFLRVYWNSCHRLVRQTVLFKTIRSQIKDRAAAFQLVRELDGVAPIYAALRSPDDERWTPAERRQLIELQVFDVRQHLSMLGSAYQRIRETDPAAFLGILKAVKVISFRYHVIGNRQAHEQERVYNQVAQAISRGEMVSQAEVMGALRSIYVSDTAFQAAFQVREFVTTNTRAKKLARYVLVNIEQRLRKTDLDFNSSRMSIEHICPENPEGPEWEEAVERKVYRLGNMILLNATENRDGGNAGFAAKRAVYETSDYRLAQYVANHFQEWDSGSIDRFQSYLARQASTIWQLQ